MIYIKTIAYNAEKTLKRAVDSILNQTYGEFQYYLCDNGSTDNGKTRKIIEEYAKADNRIVPFYNEKNHVWDKNLDILTLAHDIDDEDFYCTLDADDEYDVTFLEEMLAFMNEQDLDIAACGNDFINSGDNKLIGRRLLSQNLILQGNGFADHLPLYHQFIRTMWGKLFKGKMTKKTFLGIDPNDPIPCAYGNDTFFTMCALKGANRVGILAKSLHKYYISKKSISYNYHPDRIKCDIILHEAALDLLKPYGEVSLGNLNFLYAVYYNATKDTLNVLVNSNLSILEKMQYIREAFVSKYMKTVLIYVLNNDNLFHYKLLRKNLLKFLINQNDARDSQCAHLIAEIIKLMYIDFQKLISDNCFEYLIMKMPEQVECLINKDYFRVLKNLDIWYKNHNKDNHLVTELELVALSYLNTPDDEFFDLLIEVQKKRPISSKELQIDEQIIKLLSKYPLLENLSPILARDFNIPVRWVMRNNIPQAFDAFISIDNVYVNNADLESYIMLGQNLSAFTENMDAFIYFKKMMISYFINDSRIEEATREFDEYESLLPNDSDFAEFRKKLRIYE